MPALPFFYPQIFEGIFFDSWYIGGTQLQSQVRPAAVLRVLNPQKTFDNLSSRPIIINDLNLRTKKDRETINELVVTTYEGNDTLSNVPSCFCRNLTTRANLNRICDICGEVVASPIARDIESHVWIRSDPGIIEKLIFPNVWSMLTAHSSWTNFSFLEWVGNYNYRVRDRIHANAVALMEKFNASGMSRGWNSIYQNFDVILEEYLLAYASDKDKMYLREFCARYHDKLFVDIIPLPSKVIVAVDKVALGAFYNKPVDGAVEAAFTAATIGQMKEDIEQGIVSKDKAKRLIESRMTTVVAELARFNNMVWKEIMSPKQAWMRRSVYGHRVNLSFRSVVTSRHGPHKYDELLIPYSLLLNMLRPVVIARLVKLHGLNMRQAKRLVTQNATRRHPTLVRILEDIINDTPPLELDDSIKHIPSAYETLTTQKRVGKGIGCTFTRYPSLRKLSSGKFRIVGMTDDTAEISVLVLAAPNCDAIINLKHS